MNGPVLGIETSCDETSAAIVDGEGIRGLAIASQDAHAAFGGVVPEIAARAHVRTLDAMVGHALTEAGMSLDDLHGVGVTAGPGLVGALLVGVNWAKGLAFARELPLLGVHHMEGHLFATSLEDSGAVPPFVSLLVSGGHTMLLEARGWGDYRLLGATRDDAAGEAFDKVARRLGLGYPGGPEIEAAARAGTPGRWPLPRPMLSSTDRPGDPDQGRIGRGARDHAMPILLRPRGGVCPGSADACEGEQGRHDERDRRRPRPVRRLPPRHPHRPGRQVIRAPRLLAVDVRG